MEEIKTKGEMLKEFHKMLGVTCEKCHRSKDGYGYNIVYCQVLRMTVNSYDYCSHWKEKTDEVQK